MYKKCFLFVVAVLSNIMTNAQCAMCKAVVEGGEENIAQGVNNGITYLMIFPYVLVGLLVFMLYRYRQKMKN